MSHTQTNSIKTRLDEMQKKYESNPKYCKSCGNPIPWKQRGNIYCNRKCYGDSLDGIPTNRPCGWKKEIHPCPICQKPTVNDYCSKPCGVITRFREKARLGQFLNGNVIRSYLTNLKKPWKCDICKLTTWNWMKIPLDIHHEDGNHLNNSDANLKYYCPNCHAQTSTYKNRNKGFGRKTRTKKPD